MKEQPKIDSYKSTKNNSKTNSYEILSLVFAFILFPVGIVFGILGIKEARKTDNSATLSKVGLITSIVIGLFFVAMLSFIVVSSNNQSDIFDRIENGDLKNRVEQINSTN